jgi:hypothetical protein
MLVFFEIRDYWLVDNNDVGNFLTNNIFLAFTFIKQFDTNSARLPYSTLSALISLSLDR